MPHIPHDGSKSARRELLFLFRCDLKRLSDATVSCSEIQETIRFFWYPSPEMDRSADVTDAVTEDVADSAREDRGIVTALARGLEILSCFRFGESTLSNTELAQCCGLPKSTVSRLTQTLTKLGYLLHIPESGRYRLGTSCLALGSAMLTRLDVRTIARPLMQELASATGLSVSLCVPHKLSMIYLDHCRSAQTLSLTLDVGSRIPMATSAVGRAWMASLPAPEREELVRQIQAADPEQWPTVRDGIERAMDEYQKSGVTSSFGDWKREVVAIARAFSPGNGLPNMAVNLGGAAYNVAPEVLMKDGRPRLIEMVQNLEALLHRGAR